MKLKALSKMSDDIKWPTSSNDLPVLTWDECEWSFGFSTSGERDSALTFLLLYYSPGGLQDSRARCCVRLYPRR